MASVRRSIVGQVVLATAVLAAGVALAVVAVRGPAEPRTFPDRARAVASTLRCPVCQNLSVADSSSRLAQEMRASIARDLRAGRSPEEIREDFVAAYGEWILLSPPRRGINWVPWIAPLLLMAAGTAVAVMALRRWVAGDTPDAPAPSVTPDGEPLTAEDLALLERARWGAREDQW